MRLVVLHKNKTLTFPLDKSDQILGRDSKADIQINNKKISREHLLLECSLQTLIVRDLNSRNGFYINEKRVKKATLQHNETFSIGDFLFIFQETEDDIPENKIEYHTQRHLSKYLIFILFTGVFLSLFLYSLVFRGSLPTASPKKLSKSILDGYLDDCHASLSRFEIYFKSPVKQINKLYEATQYINKPVGMKNLDHIQIAQKLESLYKIYLSVGHQWKLMTDVQLLEIKTLSNHLKNNSHSTSQIKKFFRQLSFWSQKQLNNWKILEQAKKIVTSDPDLDFLITFWEKLENGQGDHIYASQQKSLSHTLSLKIGGIYLKEGKKHLENQNKEAGHQALEKAQNFGRAEEAQRILDQFYEEMSETQILKEAQQALEQKKWLLALRLATQIKSALLNPETEKLKHNIKKGQFLDKIKTAFTKGELAYLDSLARQASQLNDQEIEDSIKKIHHIIDLFNKGAEEFDQENYEVSKKLYQRVINLTMTFSGKNHYRNQAFQALSSMVPEALAEKHYRKGLRAINKEPPHYSQARHEFALAERYLPDIAKEEINLIASHVSRQIAWFKVMEHEGDTQKIKEAKKSLKKYLDWMHPPQSEEDLSYEASIYRELSGIVKEGE